MLETVADTFNALLGIGITQEMLTWWHMALRAVVVFMAALALIRVGSHRIFGKSTAFDIVLGIIYGSVLSRTITGNAPFWPTLEAALTLVLLHKLLAVLAFKTGGTFGDLIKGKSKELVKDGQLQWDRMRSSSVTQNDIEEALRRAGHKPDISTISSACLERNGDISIICKE